jgi:peptidoglycan glycosyltransferase
VNNQIRSVGLAALLVFGIVLANLTWLQVIRAETLVNHERNLRLLLREYSIERGAILSADGQTLAQSQPTQNEELKFLRLYPHGQLFAHVTGFYSLVYGREGLERTHNKDLSGRGGVLTIQDLGDLFLGRGQKGDTLVLSIDSRLQTAASEALGNRKGAVVAIDPLNGQVLAMAAFPSFDPNPLSGHSPDEIRAAWQAHQNNPDKPMLNRASAEAYPPGSTFKVVTAAAALEAGRGVDTAYPAGTEYQPPQTDRVIHNFGGASCGGTMADALRVSCNIYFAQLGAELSQEAFEATANGFGFGEVPPLDLRTGPSRIPSPENLRSPAFRAQAAIGQFDVTATPLQMALVAAGIANDGQVPVPKLVKEVRDARGVVVDQASAEVWREAISPQTSETLTQLMVSVVESGTGTGARIAGIKVAGKTGTAQTGREGDAPHAWFIAFAPADAPRIAVAVIVENGGDLGNDATGGRLAAPIAKRVIETYREVAGW